MFKLFTILISSLGLIGCTTSASVMSIGELITKHNGEYIIQAQCVNGHLNWSHGLITDSTGSSQAFITTLCHGYGKMRVIKEGTSIRVLSFTPIPEIKSINSDKESYNITPQGIVNNKGLFHDFSNNGVVYK